MKRTCMLLATLLAAAAQTVRADGTLPLRSPVLQTDLDGGGHSVTNLNSLTATGTVEAAAITIGGVNLTAIYQPLDATLTSLAGGTIGEDLDNTAYPWADNEVSDTITVGSGGSVDDGAIPAGITRDTEWDTLGEIETATGANILDDTEGLQDLSDDTSPTLGGDLDGAGFDGTGFETLGADQLELTGERVYEYRGSPSVLTNSIANVDSVVPWLQSWCNQGGADAWASYTRGPAHGEGSDAFAGASLAPNGKVVLAPRDSGYVGIYDPVANTYTRGPAHGEGSDAFIGAALAPNGKVVLAPLNSSYVGIYDPVANTYTRGPAHGEGSLAFLGAALAPNGKIVLVPYNSSYVGIYDPVANTYTRGPAHGEGNGAFAGASLAPNGKVVFAPYSSSYVGIYDPVANTYTRGPAHGEGNGAFIGAALAPNGKVVLAPLNSSYVGIYDPVANTYTRGPVHGEGGSAFYGAALAPNGKVVLAPRDSGYIGIYDGHFGAVPTANCLSPFINKL